MRSVGCSLFRAWGADPWDFHAVKLRFDRSAALSATFLIRFSFCTLTLSRSSNSHVPQNVHGKYWDPCVARAVSLTFLLPKELR
jgi:hypothetical protein